VKPHNGGVSMNQRRASLAVRVVDSHTEGEPTRVVLDGWPQPPGATMAERRAYVAEHQDDLRGGVACEPRGHDAMVGALLTPPVHAGSAAGVVFFNNVDVLWMCGHGTIGVIKTLEHLGRLPGFEQGDRRVALDTPVGTVTATVEADGAVTLRNVPASVFARDVEVDVPSVGRVRGDVAWGGNWFFLAHLGEPPVTLEHATELTRVSEAIRRALAGAGVTGRDGAEIDHVELFGPPSRADADSRNFVLCPGAAYDRSPCGTGTSAKMAVLHARGELALGAVHRQESLTGGLFEGWLEAGPTAGEWIPFVRGRAWVTGEATLLFDPTDPFRRGFTAARPQTGDAGR
jgi:4-hydroxyproline epimerase